MPETIHTPHGDVQQQRVRLNPDVMACIKTVTADADLPPITRLTGVLMLIYGWASFDGQDEVDPSAIALPASQWEEVCRALLDGDQCLSGLVGVNLGMEFVSKGPASYPD